MNMTDVKWNIDKILREANIPEENRNFINKRISTTLDEFSKSIIRVIGNG